MSLNVEAMTELIAELRSGNWKPGRSKLRTPGDLPENDTFCCLGVACEIAIRHGVIPAPERGRTSYDDDDARYVDAPDQRSAVLPKTVWEWFGFDEDAPSFGGFDFAPENDQGASQQTLAHNFELMLESDQVANLPDAHSRKDG